MAYHIDTGLIKDKFKVDCECPLCEIKQIVEEQFLYEFLNDAVMEENTRLKVNALGFCEKHFNMLYSRQNKLSVALQISTRVDTILKTVQEVKNVKHAVKQAEALDKMSKTCIICDLVQDSMVKYYKTVAQMFSKEENFFKTLIGTKGFCLNHYAELLRFSSYAGGMAKEYVEVLSGVQKRNMTRLQEELKGFCLKHDYRNALSPLGKSETALPRMSVKLYGKEEK
ncbi:MAG: hypothetical protein E7369_00675 [Clostridiales bacterium]|nr:hypothetical protein [Clostridiales bacterium]